MQTKTTAHPAEIKALVAFIRAEATHDGGDPYRLVGYYDVPDHLRRLPPGVSPQYGTNVRRAVKLGLIEEQWGPRPERRHTLSLTSDGLDVVDADAVPPLSITADEAKLLAFLAERPLIRQTQYAIEAGMDITRRTVGKYLRSLASKGLVHKFSDGVAITEAGLEVVKPT